MNTRRVVVILILLCGVALAISFFLPHSRHDYIPLKVPRGSLYPFPADANRLIDIRNRQLVHKMRDHTWSIFAGLTQPIGGKTDSVIWQTWFTKCDVFLNMNCVTPSSATKRTADQARLMGALEISPQSLLNDEKTFNRSQGISPEVAARLANANVPLNVVLFNGDAAWHIRDSRLWDSKELESLRKELNYLGAPMDEREVPSFPIEAVALKTQWRIIKGGQNGGGKDYCRGQVRVWDTRRVFPETPEENENFEWGDTSDDGRGGWSRKYCVEIQEGQCKPDLQNHTVPLSCFFHFRLTDEDVEAIKEDIGRGNIPEKIDPQPGDYAILLGLHFITREIPDWTWSTFWWHDRPNEGRYAEYRPDTVPELWRNYLMDTTLSMRTPMEEDGKEKIIFNPYLEAIQKRGISSNCMNCHARAVYPLLPDAFPEIPWRGGENRFPADLNYDQKLRLSFLWSLRDNATEAHQEFLQSIQKTLRKESKQQK